MSGMSSGVSGRTRPGIRFDAVIPPLPEAMPRMDVAAFVGFAERGPLHCPVVIEDMVQFEQVFGVTPKLGWAANGERLTGYLAESVRAFFTQGGQRCWVVRVASSSATSNVFALPGLRRVTPLSGSCSFEQAYAQARCEGSWSDTLHVSTRLQVRPVMLDRVSVIAPGKDWEIRTSSDFVRPGDLVRIVNVARTQQAFFPIISFGRDAASHGFVLHAKDAVAFTKHTVNESNKQTWGWEVSEIGELSSWGEGRAAVVSIDMRVRDQQSADWRMENLGLTPLHPRYCGALPTDIEVHQGTTSAGVASIQSLTSRPFVESWFPLAGIANGDDGPDTSFLVPLEMEGNFGLESAANAQASSELERDGLASFDASLFMDTTLCDTRIADLMMIANDVRYSAPQPRPLQGMHAVLGWFGSTIQDEVTLIAVPDAVHSPWQGQPQPIRFSCAVENVLPQQGAAKPASFLCCNQIHAPIDLNAHMATPTGTMIRLAWSTNDAALADDDRVIEYQVQESATGDFSVVDMQWQTPGVALDIAVTSPGLRIFRVRAVSDSASSLWSDAIALRILEAAPGTTPSGAPGEAVREVHRALINLCAAQGELFPVLSLPGDITEKDAANYVQALSVSDGKQTGWGFDPEGRVGSYAAIYHPWLETRGATGIVLPLPPDGAVLGMFAARTRDRGAWVAPANRALLGVVAMHTVLPESRQASFWDAGINLVLSRPEGYTLLSEDTLSSVPELQPIHVRRLLILLRRMMLRMGEEFTFEPNDGALRDLVRQRCTSVLERMFRAGAFAGRSAAEAFQVSVDDADNTLASIDAGRLIVRVRIRPAQALRFITVRFTLGGGATGVIEEGAA